MPEDSAAKAAAIVPAYVAAAAADTLIDIRVIPRAGRTALAGERAGVLLVRLAAAAVENAANDALLALLAEALHVPRADVTLVRGDRSRSKRVRIRHMTPGDVAARLAAAQGITLL